MIARGTLLAVALVGCKFDPGSGVEPAIEDGSIDNTDAPPADARVDTPPGATCFGSGMFIECYDATTMPTNDIILTGPADTSSTGTCTKIIPQSNGAPEICLRAAATITINSSVRFRGPRPIVLLATNAITITSAGTLDVSSFKMEVGAGGNATACAGVGNGVANTANSANAGAGGGGGGGFGTPGGSGGDGSSLGSDGERGDTITPLQIRGGCRGGNGGTSSSGAGGAGGNGGGAVYMIAGNTITVAGIVKANGSGGFGGVSKAGGGGGGSGGYIVFDAPSLAVSGFVFANGGGGGEGGGGGQSGESGNDPNVYNQRASGGNDNDQGGDGGGGSVFANSGGGGGAIGNGGGGGGGGAGRIKIYQASVPVGARFSPPAL